MLFCVQPSRCIQTPAVNILTKAPFGVARYLAVLEDSDNRSLAKAVDSCGRSAAQDGPPRFLRTCALTCLVTRRKSSTQNVLAPSPSPVCQASSASATSASSPMWFGLPRAIDNRFARSAGARALTSQTIWSCGELWVQMPRCHFTFHIVITLGRWEWPSMSQSGHGIKAVRLRTRIGFALRCAATGVCLVRARTRAFGGWMRQHGPLLLRSPHSADKKKCRCEQHADLP